MDTAKYTDLIEALKWAVTAEEPIEFNEKQTKISFNEYKEPDYSEFTPEEITCGKEILKNNLLHGNMSFEAQRYNTRSFIWEQFTGNLFQLSKPFNYKKYYQKDGIDKIESNDSFFKRREKQQKLPKHKRNILNGNTCTYIDWEENLFITRNLVFKTTGILQYIIELLHYIKRFLFLALFATAVILSVRFLPDASSLMIFAILMLFIFSFIVFIYPYQKAYKVLIDIESLKNAIPKGQLAVYKEQQKESNDTSVVVVVNNLIKQEEQTTINLDEQTIINQEIQKPEKDPIKQKAADSKNEKKYGAIKRRIKEIYREKGWKTIEEKNNANNIRQVLDSISSEHKKGNFPEGTELIETRTLKNWIKQGLV
ncbi:MAG: hypothetical protein AB7U85_06730 [Alphaproteobacteria bacterium]